MSTPTGNADSATPRMAVGVGAAGLALFFWAWPSIIGKALPIESLPLVFFRGWLGTAWAVGVLYASGRRLTLAGLRASFWGGIALGFDLVFFFTAIKLTTIANTMIISALQPVLLIFAAPLLFKERLRWPDVGAALLAVGGVVMVLVASTGSSLRSPRGDFFAVLTLFAWTGYLIASKKARSSVGSTEFAASVTLIATVLVTPLVLVSGQSLTMPEPIHWLGLAAMAISGWAGHVLMNWSLGLIPIGVGGTCSLAIPVMASGLAVVFLGEILLPIQVIGMAVVLVSLTVVGIRTPKVIAAEPPTAS